MLRALSIIILLVAGTLVCGCADSMTAASVDYSTTAKGNYDRAVAEMHKENYPDAVKLFQYVKSKYGFSQWATLAELGIADANFGREKYGEAVEDYRSFAKKHPTHPQVVNGYAAFRVGEAYYKEIPSEWFLVPPSWEKDQGPVRDALRELSYFLVEYPDSEFIPKAQSLEEDCVRRLAEHELYVAQFYMARNKPLAAIGRLDGLVKGSFLPKLAAEAPSSATGRLGGVASTYLHEHLEPEVLLSLGKTYLSMNKPDMARLAFERLIQRHPDDYHAKKAKLFLDHMAASAQPAVAPAAPPPPAPTTSSLP